LETEHVEAMFAAMTRAGKAPGTVQHVKRTLRAALNEAMARGHIGRNAVQRASGPRLNEFEIEPLSTDEAKQVLAAAADEPNGAAFVLALSLGLRRGEVLALHWEDVDLDRGLMTIKRSMGRLPWRHGCANNKTCSAGHHTARCRSGCTLHARHCPDRHGGRNRLRHPEEPSGSADGVDAADADRGATDAPPGAG
jgi:integrase